MNIRIIRLIAVSLTIWFLAVAASALNIESTVQAEDVPGAYSPIDEHPDYGVDSNAYIHPCISQNIIHDILRDEYSDVQDRQQRLEALGRLMESPIPILGTSSHLSYIGDSPY